MHSCFTCEYRDLPIAKHPCKKGLTDEKGIVLNCLGHSDMRGTKSGNRRSDKDNKIRA